MKNTEDNKKDSMYAIYRALLLTVFAEDKVDAILEIAYATGNPKTSVEMMTDIYEEPVIPGVPNSLKHFNNYKKNMTFVSYDKFKDRVDYTYNEFTTNEEKVEEVKRNKDGDIILFKDSCKLEDWLKEDNTNFISTSK